MDLLLDTNICIYLIKRKPPDLIQTFTSHPVGAIGISSITIAELQYGVRKSQQSDRNQAALAQFLLPLISVDFDEQAAVMYGIIRAHLESQGRPIGGLDMLIAAQALSLDLTLVTNNTREFARIPDLKLENWVSEQPH